MKFPLSVDEFNLEGEAYYESLDKNASTGFQKLHEITVYIAI